MSNNHNTSNTDKNEQKQPPRIAATSVLMSTTKTDTNTNTTTSNNNNNDDMELRCQKWVESGLLRNESIQYLIQHLIDLGCSPPPNKFIRCVNCQMPAAGGFSMVVEQTIQDQKQQQKQQQNKVEGTTHDNQFLPLNSSNTNDQEPCHSSYQNLLNEQQKQQQELDNSNGTIKSSIGNSTTTTSSTSTTNTSVHPEIYLCQQYQQNEQMVHRTLQHELIHAIDTCRSNMDPVRNCVQLACTEIRAENLSGECSFYQEVPRTVSSLFASTWRGQHKSCVERRATLSVQANPLCTKRADEYVKAAMNRCYVDYYPFDEHPSEK